MSDEEIVWNKLKSACECMKYGKSKNPVFGKLEAIKILEDWKSDKTKPQTFKELCSTVLALYNQNEKLKEELKVEQRKNAKLKAFEQLRGSA